MKKDKIIYWIATSIVGLMGAMAGIMYFANPMVAEGFKLLGFPDYFRVELGIAKLIGVLVLLIPAIALRFKEWAYAGFGIVFISAAIAHGVVEGPANAVSPLVSLLFLVVSYVYFTKVNKYKEVRV
ncbi:MAG: hypothetical protein K0S33_1776 [Bacteroidetes bacterium]|jgi:hypothetical protein|nr:hypothetical protein [Bacteroidota bacterium]